MKNNIVVVAWREDLISSLLQNPQNEVTLVLDSFDFTKLDVNNDIFKHIKSLHRVKNLDSIEEITQVSSFFKNQVYLVLGATERGQMAAGLLGHFLGSKHFDLSTSRNVRNKLTMKSLVKSSGIATPQFTVLDPSNPLPNDHDFLLNFPVVAKPVSGVGSRETKILKTHLELSQLRNEIASNRHADESCFLLESLVCGREFHADAVWHEGKCSFFSISEYFKPVIQTLNSPQDGGSILLPYFVFKHLYEDVFLAHKKINSALGITSGITHFEFFVDDNNNQIIFSEIANRTAGAGINDMVSGAFGKSLTQIFSNRICDLQSSNAENTSIFYGYKESADPYHCWINLSPQRSGIISQLADEKTLFKTIRKISRVRSVKRLGEFFEFKHPNWCQFICFSGSSSDEIRNIKDSIFDTFKVEVQP
jgi:hypothetical protein